MTYNLALINHRRATGELLQQHDISWADYCNECEGVKSRVLFKPTGSSAPQAVPQPVVPAPVPGASDEPPAKFQQTSAKTRPAFEPTEFESRVVEPRPVPLPPPAKIEPVTTNKTTTKRTLLESLFKRK